MDIKGMLLSIERVSEDPRPFQDKRKGDDIALVTSDKYEVQNSELFRADSADAFARINSSCYWLPIYYATRSRTRGLIVEKMADGNFQRLGFAEFMTYSTTLKHGEKRTIRLV